MVKLLLVLEKLLAKHVVSHSYQEHKKMGVHNISGLQIHQLKCVSMIYKIIYKQTYQLEFVLCIYLLHSLAIIRTIYQADRTNCLSSVLVENQCPGFNSVSRRWVLT